MWLFVAFLTVPLIEIGLFIQIGGLIGLWPTLGIVVLTAILGTWLVRTQGAGALADIRRSFSELNDPTEPIAHGAMILVAGALLLTPGFFTDAVGFLLLMPGVRRAAMRKIGERVRVRRFEMGGQTGGRPNQGQPHRRPAPDRSAANRPGDVIEGEYHEVPSDKRPNHPGSGWTKH
ncbi:FxsA family protein [Roseivivax sp. CAU 1761]